MLINNSAESRYEIEIEDHIVFLEYQLTDKTIRLRHTYVPPELRGKGAAVLLADLVFEDIQLNKYTVISECSFIRKYMERKGL